MMTTQMNTIHKQLQNPLTRKRDDLDRTRLIAAFPILRSNSDPYFLALRRYLDSRPEKFFDETSYTTYLSWLQRRDKADRNGLKQYLSQSEAVINHALLFLREINSEEWHDSPLTTGGDYELIRVIDRHVHPTYLRLVEAVLATLTRPIAYFSRIDRNKGTDDLDVWSTMQELERLPEKYLTSSYRHIIRNGIAHGGISFREKEILYRDSKGNEETFSTAASIRFFDDLLDTCNGLAAALKVFFLVSRNRGYTPPRELLIEELQEETRTPWWTIEGCVDSEIPGKSQLIVYARPASRRYALVKWATVQSGILAEFFAPGYDRYFLSIRPRRELWPGWAAFDGAKMRNLREQGADDLLSYRGVIENDLIFYDPQPAFPETLGRVDNIVKAFATEMPIVMQQIRENLGIPRIVCRNSSVHRNSWGAVLKADVIIDDLNEETAFEVIRKHRGRIVGLAMSHARKANRFSIACYLPIGYAYVMVFRRDYRRRRLSVYGLDDDLVCTVRFQRIRRIKAPDIFGSTVETMGNWRIAWNRSWLATKGK